MKNKLAVAALLIGSAGAAAGVALSSVTSASGKSSSAGRATLTEFPDARLKIEYNATDGDAGLQLLLDAPAWKQVRITNPNGRDLLEIEAEQVIRNYGLTELFAESSEPPFDEFPFEEFKQLFPEGVYVFSGRTIDGQRLRSTFTLTHRVPDGPVITSPIDGSTVAPDQLTVAWRPVNSPAGVDVVAYQVLVVADQPFVGNPVRVLDAQLPATAARLEIPAEFLTPGAYKAEVLAIERGGNQTLTEVAFTVE
jgi:hypothetical protein